MGVPNILRAPTHDFAKFSQKTERMELKDFGPPRERAFLAPPLDPPMVPDG